MFLPTSQWSLDACSGGRIGRTPHANALQDTPQARGRQAEEICRALVASTTPDGQPVLRRPLAPPERRRLVARVAELEPYRRALARITAVLNAPVAGDLTPRAAPGTANRLGRKPDAPAKPSREPRPR